METSDMLAKTGMGSPILLPGMVLREPEAEYAARLRIYVDTSVFGGCEDEKFQEESLQLFEAFYCGTATLVYSEVTERELKNAPLSVRAIIKRIPEAHFETLPETEQAHSLAKAYIEAGAVGPKHFNDALHVAIASIGEVDVIASWNFKHLVRPGRVQAYNVVNERRGHPKIDIQFPEDISYDEQGR
ncbi:MAG: type II toxin-antitoxin system VapC family toxin [Gammaproteobacteria bacterium]|nr:type II toxin-antitoxin system VapC family toxin [Gammaproteobacteria bacterium]MYH46222.1 type II toxin-antitoxin system VapC family toxin [Gammaproteobacteria bacterium]